jgi:hypothetical protein
VSEYKGLPDPTRCRAEVAVSPTWGRYAQCAKAPTQEPSGVPLCTTHAKKALADGRISVVVGHDGFRWQTTVVTVEPDPDLVAAKKAKEREQERRWRVRNGLHLVSVAPADLLRVLSRWPEGEDEAADRLRERAREVARSMEE